MVYYKSSYAIYYESYIEPDYEQEGSYFAVVEAVGQFVSYSYHPFSPYPLYHSI